MTVIHEPHNLGSSPSDRPDLFAPLNDTAYDIAILSAYASANVSGFSKDARAPILRREAENHERYDVRLATIGPGLKLLAFSLNHAGVLGDDAKKVIAEQATVSLAKGHTRSAPQNASCVPIYRFPFIPFMPFLLMLENANPSPLSPTP